MRGRSWSRLFSGTCSHSRHCFSWEFDLWSRLDRTWMAPGCWTEGLNYGPVFTWYRSQAVFPDRLRFVAARSTKPVRITRNLVILAHHRGLVPALKTGPFDEGCCPRNNDHCPLERKQTLWHKTHPVSLWLLFSEFCGQLERTKNWSIRREMLPLFSLYCHCPQWS